MKKIMLICISFGILLLNACYDLGYTVDAFEIVEKNYDLQIIEAYFTKSLDVNELNALPGATDHMRETIDALAEHLPGRPQFAFLTYVITDLGDYFIVGAEAVKNDGDQENAVFAYPYPLQLTRLQQITIIQNSNLPDEDAHLFGVQNAYAIHSLIDTSLAQNMDLRLNHPYEIVFEYEIDHHIYHWFTIDDQIFIYHINFLDEETSLEQIFPIT